MLVMVKRGAKGGEGWGCNTKFSFQISINRRVIADIKMEVKVEEMVVVEEVVEPRIKSVYEVNERFMKEVNGSRICSFDVLEGV